MRGLLSADQGEISANSDPFFPGSETYDVYQSEKEIKFKGGAGGTRWSGLINSPDYSYICPLL